MLEVIIFSLLGGLISLSLAMVLLTRKKQSKKITSYVTAFAAGVLLATAFGDLLVEALHELEHSSSGDSRTVMIAALSGILAFFFLERFVRWFHHHHDEDEGSKKASSSLVIIGDTLHNAIDGIAIGAAFLISPTTGIVTTLAVALHEIPQEVGDFGLLLRNGMKPKRVLLVNAISALATVVTAVATYALGESFDLPLAYLLAVTAGFFIYIATSDIIPELHEKITKKTDLRPWILLFGSLLILFVSPIAHDFIEAEDHSEETTTVTVEHKDFMVPAGEPVPTVDIEVLGDLEKGLTVRTITSNFRFTPEKEMMSPVNGEGHAHIYVDGKKITRLYAEWAFISPSLLPENACEVTVSLSNNDHSEYHRQDETAIRATAKLSPDCEPSESHDEASYMNDDHSTEEKDNHSN